MDKLKILAKGEIWEGVKGEDSDYSESEPDSDDDYAFHVKENFVKDKRAKARNTFAQRVARLNLSTKQKPTAFERVQIENLELKEELKMTQCKIARLEERIEELIYAPGGEAFQEAKKRFEDLAK